MRLPFRSPADAACRAGDRPGVCGRGKRCSHHHRGWWWVEPWGWRPRSLPHAIHTGGEQRGLDLGREAYSDAAQDEQGWWYASHFTGRRRTTIGPFLDRDEALAALRLVGDEPTAQIDGRRLEGPASAPRLVDDRIATRSSFIELLRRVIPQALKDLDDGHVPLPDVLEATVAAGVGAMDRFLVVTDGPGSMTRDTARSLALGVLWESAAPLTAGEVRRPPVGLRSLAQGAVIESDLQVSQAVQRLLAGRPAEGTDSELLSSIVPRLIEVHAAAQTVTEIGVHVGGGYPDFGYGETVLRRDGSAVQDESDFGPSVDRRLAVLDRDRFADLARAVVALGLHGADPGHGVLDAGTTTFWVCRGADREAVDSLGSSFPAATHSAMVLVERYAASLAWEPDPAGPYQMDFSTRQLLPLPKEPNPRPGRGGDACP